MSESIYQLKLNASIDAVFAKLSQRTDSTHAIPSEPKTFAEAHASLAKSEARYRAAIDKVFAALKAPEPEPTLAAAEPQTSMENLPADFLPRDQTRGGDYVQAQPWWSR